MGLVRVASHLQAPSFCLHPTEPVPFRGPMPHITDPLGCGLPVSFLSNADDPHLSSEMSSLEDLGTLDWLLVQSSSVPQQGLIWSCHLLLFFTNMTLLASLPPHVSWSVRVAIINYGRLDGLDNRCLFLTVVEVGKSKTKVPVDSVSGEDLLPGS